MNKIEQKELKEIIDEFRNGNSLAFEKLYSKYNKLVYGIAFTVVKSREDSEDVVQDVYSKIYKMQKEKLPNSNHASWLYTVTKNEAISKLRKKKENIDIDDIYEVENENDEMNKIMDQEKYNSIIYKLNDKERQIVSLKILAELSFSDIAKLVNESEGTVKWRYYTSIHTLKLMLSSVGMSVVSFLIGAKVLNNMKTLNKASVKDNISKQEETMNQSELFNGKIDNDIESETLISSGQQNNNYNFVGTGFICISLIFLIISIIFLIKYQLKRKIKPSK